MRDPEMALDIHVRQELGLNPEELGSPWGQRRALSGHSSWGRSCQ
jgi:hypothetical protein